jgi:hypothetical protein
MKRSVNTRTGRGLNPGRLQAKRGLVSRLRASEHAVSVGALRSRDLFLQNVPMFRDLAIGHAENIDPNHGLRSPSDIVAMNHDIVAIGHDK